MRGPLFQRSLGEITGWLAADETIEDIEALYTVIVRARQARLNRGEDDEEIALFSLCFFGWPGKAPAFREQIQRFRRGFAGIASDGRLREDFRSRLLPRLLNAATVRDLTPLADISEVFLVTDEDSDSGAKKLGLPPVMSPDLKYYATSSAPQVQPHLHAR